MKKIFYLLLMMLLPVAAGAEPVEIDGIWYNLVSKAKKAEVTNRLGGDSNGRNTYSGSVSIPPAVNYDGVEYSVTNIGESAFEDCTGLTSVTIPNSVTSIGGWAFYACTGLTSVTIPNSVTSIGDRAFRDCTGLTSITIPNSVTSIGGDAFSGCSGLTSVTIPNSVTSIGGYAFSGCSGLTSVTIGNSVTSIGYYVFYGCSGLTSVTIPNSVTSIESYAFSACTGLTSVTIPNSVTSIEWGAFEGCTGLTSVTIPNSVTSINCNAFAKCPELTDVYCYAENVPRTCSYAFQDSYIEYSTLHVPTASIDAYKSVEPWKNFKTIIGLDGTLPDTPEPEKCATPTISYGGKRLSFGCATEGVEYVYEIRDVDIRKGYDSEVTLTGTYEISVYATKAGYSDSDIATATLVWNTATFTETTGAQSVAALTREAATLITTRGGVVAVDSEAEGQPVTVYSVGGQQLGAARVSHGRATVSTGLQAGQVAIVRIGSQSVKVAVQ